MNRRIASWWFPKLASDRFLRTKSCDAPFALTIRDANTERIYCLNAAAEIQGLAPNMPFSDARALFPDLRTAKAKPLDDRRFLTRLARFAERYCPWVGLEGGRGLALDITGAAHLFGGEDMMMADMRATLARLGLDVRIGIADTRGAAWALAHFCEGIAAAGESWTAIRDLPVASLRLNDPLCGGLERLGVRSVAELAALPRVTVTRRFGPTPLWRLDQALGDQPETLTRWRAPEIFSARLTLPEPVGLQDDIMAALERLLDRVCERLRTQGKGARILQLMLRRVDRNDQKIELKLARAMDDGAKIQALFAHRIERIDAGFGIDQIRLQATAVEDLPATQISVTSSRNRDPLADLITRLGNRTGLENIIRFLPADSHIPERSFVRAPAAYSEPVDTWPKGPPRPVRLFPPERIRADDGKLPDRFRWRSMDLAVEQVTGPERIAPEWWWDDPAWITGLRDYWRVETKEGWRLWLFHTPQNPGWYVHGEFA